MKKLTINKNIDAEILLKNRFHQLSKDKYLFRTPVYKYKKKYSLLYLEFLITLDDTPILTIDCKDNNQNLYRPFYNAKYSDNNKVLEGINQKLNTIIKRMIENKIIETSAKEKE